MSNQAELADEMVVTYKDIDFDLAIFPREAIDPENVKRLRDALEAGVVLPAVILDDATSKLVDGVHRCRAYFGLYGADAVIPCERRIYLNQREMLLDAIRLNARQGKPLREVDRPRIVALAARHTISAEQLASALSISSERVLSMRSASTAKASRQTIKTRRPWVRVVTSERDDGGYRAPAGQREINVLLSGLHNGSLDLRDTRIRHGLEQLLNAATRRLRETAA